MPPFDYEIADVPENRRPDHTEAVRVEHDAARSMRIVRDLLKSTYIDTRSFWRKFIEGSTVAIQSPSVTYTIEWPDEIARLEDELDVAFEGYAKLKSESSSRLHRDELREERRKDSEGEMQVRAWLQCYTGEFTEFISLWTQLERVYEGETTVRRKANPRVESRYGYDIHYLDYPGYGQERLSVEDRLILATALNETVSLLEAVTNQQQAYKLD